LTGPNGAGKTNLLEALSFLAPGRGLRHARLSEPSRRLRGAEIGLPARNWAVAAVVEDSVGCFKIGTGLVSKADGEGKRAIRINGVERQSQACLSERMAILWITPDMQRLFNDGAGGRRRFLDRMIIANDPEHSVRLNAYDKVLRGRARVLSDARRDNREPDYDWLNALEVKMVEIGMAIVAARMEMAQRLNRACALGVGLFPAARLELAGTVDFWLRDMPAIDAEEKFLALLQKSRVEDSISRGAAIGPHKSDLEVQFIERETPARECSTGEQKALLLSITLAYARLQTLEKGFPPILLLDEVIAHLDHNHREGLFEELLGLGTQAWMTGTECNLFSSLRDFAQHFVVTGASLEPAH
jgi:DNA replication and repair protein RecF